MLKLSDLALISWTVLTAILQSIPDNSKISSLRGSVSALSAYFPPCGHGSSCAGLSLIMGWVFYLESYFNIIGRRMMLFFSRDNLHSLLPGIRNSGPPYTGFRGSRVWIPEMTQRDCSAQEGWCISSPPFALLCRPLGPSLEQIKHSCPSQDICPLSTRRPSRAQFTLPPTPPDWQMPRVKNSPEC